MPSGVDTWLESKGEAEIEGQDQFGENDVENNDEKDGVGKKIGTNTKKKGILEAVKDIFPYAKHRQCTRHIYANFKKKFRGIQFRNLFWAAAYSTTEQHLKDKMKELKTINNDDLIERNPKSWSRAFFEVNRACNAFENGISESFNSRIQIARRKPIITMLEEIITYVMHWSVIPSDYIVFEARNEYGSFVVDIQARTCSCRSWQLSGIPCVHTLAFLNKDPETYVSDWLKKDMFKEAYKKMTCQKYGGKGHNSRSCKKQKTDPLPKEVRPRGRSKRIVAATSMRASTSGAEVGDEMLGQ
nr:hypothetical protein CTI12_AA439960 [Tanacetum cinerariifolium]